MKESFIITFLLAVVTFFTPVAPLMLIAIAAILLDTFFGVLASIKLKKPLLSRKFQRICIKLLIYLPLIAISFPIDLYILNAFTEQTFNVPLFLTRLATTIIVGIELFSVDEKIRAFNEEKGFAYYFKKILHVLRSARKSLSSVVENRE